MSASYGAATTATSGGAVTGCSLSAVLPAAARAYLMVDGAVAAQANL